MALTLEQLYTEANKIVEKFNHQGPYRIEVSASMGHDDDGFLESIYEIELSSTGREQMIFGLGDTPLDCLLSFQANCFLNAKPINH